MINTVNVFYKSTHAEREKAGDKELLDQKPYTNEISSKIRKISH